MKDFFTDLSSKSIRIIQCILQFWMQGKHRALKKFSLTRNVENLILRMNRLRNKAYRSQALLSPGENYFITTCQAPRLENVVTAHPTLSMMPWARSPEPVPLPRSWWHPCPASPHKVPMVPATWHPNRAWLAKYIFTILSELLHCDDLKILLFFNVCLSLVKIINKLLVDFKYIWLIC